MGSPSNLLAPSGLAAAQPRAEMHRSPTQTQKNRFTNMTSSRDVALTSGGRDPFGRIGTTVPPSVLDSLVIEVADAA